MHVRQDVPLRSGIGERIVERERRQFAILLREERHMIGATRHDLDALSQSIRRREERSRCGRRTAARVGFEHMQEIVLQLSGQRLLVRR